MAAAFAALVSLQNNLLLIQNHPRHCFSFEENQIESLQETVSYLIEFMRSYGGTRKEAAAEALEMRIARAAQAAEDVVESHVVDQIHSGKTRRSKTRSSRFLLDLQKAIDGMNYMWRKAINVKVQRGSEAEQQPTSSTTAAVTSSTSNNMTSTATVGFDDVLIQLLHLLTGVPSSRRVIPIVGMGGIGKTTLATHASRHPLTVHHFDVCLWATISQQYKVEKILIELLSIDESTNGAANELGEQLYKSLYGRRYLIILDDMWSLEAWDAIKFFFPDTNDGSRIVVTTRQAEVANHLGFSSVAMSFLNEVDSWRLFCQKAFPAEQVCPSELEEIGKKIVEKCRGLPLAIVVVAGHLKRSSMTLEYWENVTNHWNSILNSTENEEHWLKALSLSYSYLPPHLKPCFLLLGAFPEDEEIYVWDILKLWISEGFIETFENSSLEMVAKHYLWDLYQRNLILVDQLGCDGEVYCFKLHDLVREFCIKIANKEEILFVFDAPQAIHGARRVVINGKLGEANLIHTKTSDARIRCLIYEGGLLSSDLKLLRTWEKVVSSSMNASIFEQVNLRYLHVDLDYKCCRNLYLPSSISLLWNLQILRITVPDQSTVIAPYEIWEMLQLRHLEIDPVCLLDPLPTDQEHELVLRNLHTLLRAKNFRLSEEVCMRIPHIRTLKVSYCDEAMPHYYCPYNLGYFHELEYLVCRFHGSSKWRDFALSLTFPASLKSLLLSGCGIDWEELTTMVGSLPHLISLVLYPHSVIGSVWNPVEGKFLSLKKLEIHYNDDLVYWNADSSHFPALKILILRKLSKLDEFPSGIVEVPTLQWIQMEFCSESATISAMRALVEQEHQGIEGLRLYVSFRGDERTLESFSSKVGEEGLTSNNLFLQLQTRQ